MRCIIVDDEPLARKNIEMMVDELPVLTLCGSFSNVVEADAFLHKSPVDLVFLDIQMPGVTGIEYLRMNKWPLQVIITTAFPQYAIDGYELDVTDYLVKPIRLERFMRAVNKAANRHNNPGRNVIPAVELDDNCIFVRADKKFIRINVLDVCYIEGMKDYSIIHMPAEKIIVAINLKTIMDQLPETYFMRISKSYVVNLSRIKQVDIDHVVVGSASIPIGNSYRDNLLKYIDQIGVLRR